MNWSYVRNSDKLRITEADVVAVRSGARGACFAVKRVTAAPLERFIHDLAATQPRSTRATSPQPLPPPPLTRLRAPAACGDATGCVCFAERDGAAETCRGLGRTTSVAPFSPPVGAFAAARASSDASAASEVAAASDARDGARARTLEAALAVALFGSSASEVSPPGACDVRRAKFGGYWNAGIGASFHYMMLTAKRALREEAARRGFEARLRNEKEKSRACNERARTQADDVSSLLS